MNDLVTGNQLIASFLLLVAAVLIRWLIVRYIHKVPTYDKDLPRRWLNATRNIITVFVVVGLIIIWLSELRFVALSVATFTVALIIASREFIQCFLGTLYQTSSRVFSIGDWIKVGSHYGEVVSSDWLTTKLLEIDMESRDYSYTGKTIVVPNSQFVTNYVSNLNFMRRYVAHSFSIVREADAINVLKAKSLLLERAKIHCEPFEEVAHRYGSLVEKRLGVQLPGPEASVRLTTTNLGKNEFRIAVFCPTEEAVNIEQKLTEDFMNFWYTELERLDNAEQEKKLANNAEQDNDIHSVDKGKAS